MALIGVLILIMLFFIYKSLEDRKKTSVVVDANGVYKQENGLMSDSTVPIGDLKDIVYYDTSLLQNEDKNLITEIEKRKKRAKELGIPKIFEYFSAPIQHYPSWIANSLDGVPSIVTSAKELENTEDGWLHSFKKYELTINKRKYTISFLEKAYQTINRKDIFRVGTLQIFQDNEKVLNIVGKLDGDVWYRGLWHCNDFINVTSFIEGDWVDDFKQIYEEYKIKVRKDEEGRDKFQEQQIKGWQDKGVQDLKKGFGIK